MKIKAETQIIADALVKKLKANGFVVQRYDARSTESIYLKLDYGLAYSIRISGHKGKRHLKYTYNLIKGHRGKRFVKEDKVWRQYYSFEEFNRLVENIIKNREWIKEKYHPDYAVSMEKARLSNEGKPGFWSNAQLV